MINSRIGFMQGRLVDQVDGKIQAFPIESWREEFPIAEQLGLRNIEWTLDHIGLLENPLCTSTGKDEILRLRRKHNLAVSSITGDCFMQAPFWKSPSESRDILLNEFDLVIQNAAALGIPFIVVPLVDNGKIEREEERACFISECRQRSKTLEKSGVRIVIESDFTPSDLAQLISELPEDSFGINYDIGNSASLGYDPKEEFSAYGERVYHVHMKDRLLGGSTVPLGHGNARFDDVFHELAKVKYSGLVILQTARTKQNAHAEALARYAEITHNLIEKYLGS